MDLHRPSPHLAQGWGLSNPLAQAKPPPCPRVGTVNSACTDQAPILPKCANCQLHLRRPSPHLAEGWRPSGPHLHRPSPHLARGWGLSTPLAQGNPPHCPMVGTVKSTCTNQAPTFPKGGDYLMHLHGPSPHLAIGCELSNPLARAKPPSCARVGTVKSTCTSQPPTLSKGGDCQIHLHRPSPHLAQVWELSIPLAETKPPPCRRVETVTSTCTNQAPTFPKAGDCLIHLHGPSPHLAIGCGLSNPLARANPPVAQGWGLSNPLAQSKPPPCPRVGTVRSTCTGQPPTLPKGGDCQIHLHSPSPHFAQGWGLSGPLAQAKPPPCPRVGTAESTCTGQAPTLPKGGDCQIHLHRPSPHFAQGGDLSNTLAETRPPPRPRVGTVKSTCGNQAPTPPKGGDCQVHLHRPSPDLAQGWGLSNPLAQTKPPPCPMVGTVKSTCTKRGPTLPEGGNCQIHLQRRSPHLAQGWGLSTPLAQANPPPRPRVGTVKSTCTGPAPTLPKGGDCQIHLQTPSPHLAQGWRLSNPLAQIKPPPCSRVGTAKSTCTGQAPSLPKGGDCQLHLHRESPHLAQGLGLSNPLAQTKPPPCPRLGTVKSTCAGQAPTLLKGRDCQIHLHRPSPHLAQAWGLLTPLAQTKPPPCSRVGTVNSTSANQAPTLLKGGDCQLRLHKPTTHLAQGWGLSNPLAQTKPPPCPRLGTV